jgi:hypothetical protein
MCEAEFERYANAINIVESPTSDLIPGILLYSSIECQDIQFPNTGGRNFVSNMYSSNQTISSGTWGFTVASFFIPYNYKLVVMEGAGGRKSQFVGPYFTTNTASLGWQVGGGNMHSDPITSITFTEILEWDSQAMLPQCMGKLEFIGLFSLVRYTPQTDRCDAFMMDTWCCPSCTMLNNVECACFKELPEIEAKSAKLGVELPVICFGEQCATENTYKTKGMLEKPCNLTICQQTINSTPGIINEGEDVVFCGGQFFKQNGDIAQPSITPIPGPPTPTTGEDAPFYVWIMLGASGILFMVLVYLLFAAPPKHGSSILRQIRRISQARKASRAVRPDYGTTYEDDTTSAL